MRKRSHSLDGTKIRKVALVLEKYISFRGDMLGELKEGNFTSNHGFGQNPVSTRRVFMKNRVPIFRWLIASVALMVVLPLTLSAQSAKFDEFPTVEPKAGDMAPDFTLKTVDGEDFQLSEAVAQQPVVIEFGSYT